MRTTAEHHIQKHDMYRSIFTTALSQTNNVLERIALMRKLEYWNISWWVAQVNSQHWPFPRPPFLTMHYAPFIDIYMGQRGVGHQRLCRLFTILQHAFCEEPAADRLDCVRRGNYLRSRVDLRYLGGFECRLDGVRVQERRQA